MGKKQIRTREPLRLAETVCGWHNPPGARKCEEIPYALIRLMTSHYQWDINARTKTRAHPGSELPSSRLASLACYAVARRSSPLSVGLRCVADAPSLRAQFHFFTIPKAAPLRGLPWAIVLSPRFSGLRIPLAYGSQTVLQIPIYRTQMTY